MARKTDPETSVPIPESSFRFSLSMVDEHRRAEMAEAAAEVAETMRVLARTGDNIVGELLRQADGFFEWTHYPEGDVYDAASGSQFFYHAHPADLRVGEHGHFHCFLRPSGMPSGMAPAALAAPAAPAAQAEAGTPKGANDALSHLIAISMDRFGVPVCLFTTNRWVTGETWYHGSDVIAMLDRFTIDHAQPSWPVNRWISAMIRLFRPEAEQLIGERDKAVAEHEATLGRTRKEGAAQGRTGEGGAEDQASSVHEDRRLEITSHLRISLKTRLALFGVPATSGS